eukprot:COSAG01_NODE_25298_length_749_cov_3.424615_2_plen_90_part_00
MAADMRMRSRHADAQGRPAGAGDSACGAAWENILRESSDVFVQQHVEMMEALTGFETENKWVASQSPPPSYTHTPAAHNALYLTSTHGL